MNETNCQEWFNWFYKNWSNYCPGEMIDKGLNSSFIAERFIEENQIQFLELSKNFNIDNYEALEQYMKLSESELYVLKYLLRLIKLQNKSKENH
tara:strand:+ start:421 stop:702 length:282 start_codon:yes stop_codon:yes gene_type:complete